MEWELMVLKKGPKKKGKKKKSKSKKKGK